MRADLLWTSACAPIFGNVREVIGGPRNAPRRDTRTRFLPKACVSVADCVIARVSWSLADCGKHARRNGCDVRVSDDESYRACDYLY